ncbi:MAG: hypothetical protein P4L85_19945 [Paludisphaera borealis]|uniref:hypothetical protein n=1 Tax=Paludisphaera borealis TaxID=1387353 RepID=UPI0028491170|nr:hypothetical protein [Paludisphaera borealis]MDR3621634.1 hypothetical protein [Paludisphaera borealis]
MESQIWSKSEEKWAYILMLRGHEVHRLKVTGNMLTLKRNVKAALEALEQGRAPSEAGAKSVESLDARAISKAEVSPENNSLTLHGGEDGSKELAYSTGDGNAGEILQAVLAKSDRPFQPSQEAISVFEALVPPVIIGVFAGALWGALYHSAGQLAAGEVLEAHGRRAGMQRMIFWAAELLGANGTLAVGVALLLLILGWAAQRIIRRPERTVWLPA